MGGGKKREIAVHPTTVSIFPSLGTTEAVLQGNYEIIKVKSLSANERFSTGGQELGSMGVEFGGGDRDNTAVVQTKSYQNIPMYKITYTQFTQCRQTHNKCTKSL